MSIGKNNADRRSAGEIVRRDAELRPLPGIGRRARRLKPTAAAMGFIVAPCCALNR